MVKVKKDRVCVNQEKKIGEWTLIGLPFRVGGQWHIEALCSCEKVFLVPCCDLIERKADRCYDCAIREMQRIDPTQKELEGVLVRRLYAVWSGMKSRCQNQDNENFKHYGWRGISVCEEWKNSFEVFCDWAMTNRYAPKLQIDRIDNNGNYEPSNCRFVSNKKNSRNKRNNRMITAFGETKCVAEWAEDERCKVSYDTFHHRLRLGWSPEQAITEPPKPGRHKPQAEPCETS